MSPSSLHSNSLDSGSLRRGTSFQLENNIEEHHKDTFQHSPGTLSPPPARTTFSPHAGIEAPSPLHEESRFSMPPRNRSTRRNVHIFDTNDRDTEIGGLRTNGITNANLYAMIEIFLFFDSEYVLWDESDVIVNKDDSLLQPGKYYIDSPKPFVVNSETALVRTISSSPTGPRVHVFRDAIRLQDRRCIITGVVVLGAEDDNWTGFQAAHIFPLAYEEYWNNNDFARWITTPSVVGGP